MNSIKLIALFVLIICLMPEPQVSAIFWHKWCNRRCSTYENTIFTTDGTDCIILRNSCYLNRENCQRRRYGLRGIYKNIEKKKTKSQLIFSTQYHFV